MVKRAKTTESTNRTVVFQESNIRRVWRKHKQWLNAEGSQPVTFCHGLKLLAPDGKQRETDCHDS